MIIKVRLFANLRERLPPGSDGQEGALEMPDGATPRDVIARLNIPPELAHLVMINGFHLLPADVRDRALQPGEVLSIFPPIAGGQPVGAVGDVIVKELGLTAGDFLRALPLALAGRPCERTGSGVLLADGGRRVEVALAEQAARRLGPTLRLPVLRVELRFHGYSAAQRTAFMVRFDRAFMRAGG